MRAKVRLWSYLGFLSLGFIAHLARAQIAPSAEAARPLGVGERAPDFRPWHLHLMPSVRHAETEEL
jgi:hypothetical protein